MGQTEKNSARAYVFRFARTRTLLDAFGMSQSGPEADLRLFSKSKTGLCSSFLWELAYRHVSPRPNVQGMMRAVRKRLKRSKKLSSVA
jgi:hypothetical protein